MDIEVSISHCLSRSAAQIIKQFRQLVLISLIPTLVLCGLTAISSYFQFSNLRDIVLAGDSGFTHTQNMGFVAYIWIGQVIFLLTISWFFVKIIRFRLLNECHILPTTREEITSTLFLVLYLIVYFAILFVLVSAFILTILSILSRSGGPPVSWGPEFTFSLPNFSIKTVLPLSGLGKALSGIAVLVLIAVLALFSVRFWAALPAVAVGYRPNIFKFMIRFAQGRSWAILGWWLLIGFLGSIVALPVMLMLTHGLRAAALQGAPAFLAYINSHYIDLMAINIGFAIASIPMHWLLVLFLAEIYERISKFRMSRGLPFAHPAP